MALWTTKNRRLKLTQASFCRQPHAPICISCFQWLVVLSQQKNHTTTRLNEVWATSRYPVETAGDGFRALLPRCLVHVQVHFH